MENRTLLPSILQLADSRMRARSARRVWVAGLLVTLLAGCGAESEQVDSAENAERHSVDPRAARYLVQSQQAFEQGSFNAALALTDSARHYAPNAADVYFLRGRIYTGLQRLDRAQSAYERVLELDPDYRGVWLNLGNTAYRQGQFGRALQRYRKELAVHPSPDVWTMMGRAHEERRRPDSARHAYEQAIRLDSSFATAYLRLGQVYKDQGELQKAVVVSREGMRRDPDNLNYRYALGSLLVLSGQAEEAVEELRAVVEAKPWHYWANHNLGRALMQVGHQEEGQYYLDQAEQLQDNLAEIDHWRSLAQSNPDQFMLWVKLQSALRAVSRSKEAEEAKKVALSLAPRYMMRRVSGTEAAQQNQLAGRDLMNGRVDSAIERYRTFLDRDAVHPNMWVNLGLLYAATGQEKAARTSWETALRYAPEHQRAEMFLSQIAQTFDRSGKRE